MLFFRCLSTLLNPVDRTRGGIKWGFVAHVVLMFSLVTVYTAANLDLQSISYIDNREYPGLNDGFPGPFNYEYLIYYKPISVISPVMFIMNYWLADGLLVSVPFNSAAPTSDVAHSSSSIAALLSMP